MNNARPKIALTTAGGVAALVTAPALGGILWDNGAPNGVNGYSNATVDIFGERRSLLDDFTVPDGQSWTLQEFHWHHLWATLPPGSGEGAELTLWSDSGGAPAHPFETLTVTSYGEMATGNSYFDRPEAESWVTFEEITLGSGTYWMEWLVVGPENNFILTADRNGTNECWVLYVHLMSGYDQFGAEADLAWSLEGVPTPATIVPFVLAAIATRRRRACTHGPRGDSR